MGNHLISITKYNSINIPSTLVSSKGNWLSYHSQETELSIVNVDRLWVRFLQLGANSADGVWTDEEATTHSGRIAKMDFMRHLIGQLQAPDSNQLSFCEFLHAARWLAVSSYHQKLRVCHAVINKGQPLTLESMTLFLAQLMPAKMEESRSTVIGQVFSALARPGHDSVSVIHEKDFVDFMKENVESKTIEELLHVSIIPNYKLDDKSGAEALGAMAGGSVNSDRLDRFPTNTSVPSDEQLAAVSRLVAASADQDGDLQGYRRLASGLGVLQYDLVHLEAAHAGDRYRTVLALLREWRLREGSRAFVSSLKLALHLAGMQDVLQTVEFA